MPIAALVLAPTATEAGMCARWSSYEVESGTVVYRSSIEGGKGHDFGADANTFRSLEPRPVIPFRFCRAGYGADKDAVYYEGTRVAGADPRSFEVVSDAYAKDADRWYGEGVALATRRGGDLKVLDSGYAIHPEGAFFGARRLEADGFQVLSPWYARSKNRAYFRGVEIAGVEGASFVVLDGNAFIARDATNVVIMDRIDPRFEASSFEVLESHWALVKDRRHVYYRFKPVDGADPQRAVPIAHGYWRDGRSVFYLNKAVASADALSFRVVEVHPHKAYGVDKDWVYSSGVAVCRLAKDSFPNAPMCDLAADRP